MTTVPTSPARCTKPRFSNQQQLDQQCCRSQLWTKTKEKMQSLPILLKQVRTEARNEISRIMPDTEQCCDGDLSWHTIQLLWSTFCCTDGQKRYLLVVLLGFFLNFVLKLLYPKPVRTNSFWNRLPKRGYEVSFSGDIQGPRDPVQPAVGKPTLAGKLDQMLSSGPFEAQSFCYSVTDSYSPDGYRACYLLSHWVKAITEDSYSKL